jgi:hypothetical protein
MKECRVRPARCPDPFVRYIILAMSVVGTMSGCEPQPTEPCTDSTDKPVLLISSALDQATGTPIPVIGLVDITLDGVPVDTIVLRTNARHNVERRRNLLSCILPCTFGEDKGVYAFDIFSTGYYMNTAEIAAEYANVPEGCPASHGEPTTATFRLIEADSARVHFGFVRRFGVGLASDAATVTFDDGSGPRIDNLGEPRIDYVTRNAGTMRIHVTVAAPDTIAVGDIELPLRKDWRWGVSVYVSDRNPAEDGFCVDAKAFPLRKPVPVADSLYISWGGLPISQNVAC